MISAPVKREFSAIEVSGLTIFSEADKAFALLVFLSTRAGKSWAS
jgi:hypothetical protein